MRSKTDFEFWGFVSFLIYWLVIFAVYGIDAHRAFTLGRMAGAENWGATHVGFYSHLFVAGLATFYVLIAFCAWQTRVNLTAFRLVSTLLLGFVLGVLMVLISLFMPMRPSDQYINGFAERVTTSGVESKTVAWADQLQTNTLIFTNGGDSVDLPPDQVPSFVAPIFGKMGAPQVTLYHFPMRSVDIQVELGDFVRPIDLGISVVDNADAAVARLPVGVYRGRSYGKRLMIYWGGD